MPAHCCRSAKVLTLLEQHVNAIVSRVNTITGVAYKDNPTIIGYNLFNEPR
jgi:mannan endo-1,4-beta-mannosidase